MAIDQIINKFLKKKFNFLPNIRLIKHQFLNFNPSIFIGFLVFFSIIFFSTTHFINKTNKEKEKNLTEIATSKEFSNLTNYFISKINSPYVEINYIIKNNDTVEKILQSYNIKPDDIKIISTKLKGKKLSNIYSGRKLSLIYKKIGNKLNTCLLYTSPSPRD